MRQRYGEVTAAVMLGGTEKVADNADFSPLGCPVVMESDAFAAVAATVRTHRPHVVVDLSDEPVIGYSERMRLASLVLAEGAAYVGADFRFDPPVFEKFTGAPSISIIGTGKRVGKTAVSAYLARELKRRGLDVCVVAMGRGGPPEPEVLHGETIRLDAASLVEAARAGRHAASDYYEDALMSRVTTIGCRRCGGGLAGAPYTSTVAAGARIASRLAAETANPVVVFEGSGASLPEVATDARVLVVGAGQPTEYVNGYFGTYRLLISDLVILTNCEEPTAGGSKVTAMKEAIESVKDIPVVETVFRPHPLEDVSGKDVFVATTAPETAAPKIEEHLREEFGCRVVRISHHLSNRPLLRRDLEGVDFEVLLVELKAAAVDVATEIALGRGAQVVYMDNVPVAVGGDLGLEKSLVELVGAGAAGPVEAGPAGAGPVAGPEEGR